MVRLLSDAQAVEQTIELLKMRKAEGPILNKIRRYWKGQQPLPIAPRGVPPEIRKIANMSRVNLCSLVIDVLAQSQFVDGYRSPKASDNAPAWAVWQANKMDRHQAGVHRAKFAYGTCYVKVVPGEDGPPVIQGRSPRTMTAAYGDDPAWPEFALEVLRRGGKTEYRLYDSEQIYFLQESNSDRRSDNWLPEFVSSDPHGMSSLPVVRFRNTEDLDADEPCEGDEPQTCGEIERLMPLQDQLEFTNFGLFVAQHFTAFQQRYVVGWSTEDENVKMQAAASRLMTFEDPDVKLGAWPQADTSGYLKSLEATIEHIAMISQIPLHNVIGQMVNISADALVAADASNRRKINDSQTTDGESWEQVLALATEGDSDPGAQVRWRDTESRAFAAMVDGLGKLATMLQVPVEKLWESIPGWTDTDVAQAKAMKAELDAIGSLESLLNQQMGPLDNKQAPVPVGASGSGG